MWYLATFRDPWAMGNLFIGVRGKGRQSVKKLLQPLLGNPEGFEMGCIICFPTSAPSAVHPTMQPSVFLFLCPSLSLIAHLSSY